MTKTYLKNVNFDFEADDEMPLGPHLAYCSAAVGGAASGLNDPIILKAKAQEGREEALEILKSAREVQLTISFEDFLKKFLGLYHYDASALAALLGYESEGLEDATKNLLEWGDEWEFNSIMERLDGVALLKSKDVEKGIQWVELQYAFEKGFNKLSEEEQLKINCYQESVEKGLFTGVTDSKQDKTPVGDIKTEKGAGDTMSSKENEITLESVQKALEDQGAILKQLKEENDQLKSEKEAAFEADMIEKAKGFSFVSAENASAVGKLLKSLSTENLDVMLDVFKAAQEAIAAKVEKKEEENADMFVQKATSVEDEPTPEAQAIRKAKVDAVLKAKFTKKS